MKVRITNNKIRFRLKQPEVTRFSELGLVTEALVFGSGESQKLQFSLQVFDTADINIAFQNNHTVFYVPSLLAKEWTTTGRVGFEAQIVNEQNTKITILVEKDFMCMDGREEENEGSYPNPLATINS